MWSGLARRGLAILLSLSLLFGGVAAVRTVAFDVATASAVADGAGAPELSSPGISLPKVVETQPLRVQVQPPKRDPRPTTGTGDDLKALLLIVLLAAGLLIPAARGSAHPVPVAGHRLPGGRDFGSRCPTGPPRITLA